MRRTSSILLPGLLGALALASAAHAQDSFTVRVPVLSAVHAPTTTTFDFGSVVVGTVPKRDFQFLNRSSKPTLIGLISASGNARVLSHTCNGTLAPGATCDLTLGIAASIVGKSTGAVSVNHSEALAPDVYSLSVTGVAASDTLQFDQAQVNFGKQLLREPSLGQTLTLRNKGSENAEITKVAFATPTFHYQVLENNCEGTLEPGGSCQVELAFRPQSLGVVSASLAFWLEDGSKVPAVQLQGTGVKAIPSWSAETVNFIGVPAGQTSVPQTVTLTNSGQGDMGISDLTVLDNTGESAHFSISATTCSTTLLPGASCDVSVVFNAPDTAIRSASLKLTATGTASATSPSVQLFAQPALMQGRLTVEPSSLNFGALAVGTSSSLNLTLRSVGQAPVSVSSYTLTGTHAAEFRIVNTAACVGSLAPGMQCVLQLEARPTAGGVRQAKMSVSHDAPEPVADVPLTVDGKLGLLEATPATVTFATTEVGQVATQSVVLTNKGFAALQVSKQTLAGTAAAQFTATENCVGSLAVGSSCTVTVTYKPTAAANHAATLTFANTGSNASVVVNLAGAGKAPVVSASGTVTLSCPAIAAPSAAISCTATINSTGTGNLSVSNWGLSRQQGTTKTAITAPASVCSAGSTLASIAPGKSCSVTFSFSTTALGGVTVTAAPVSTPKLTAATATVRVMGPALSLTIGAHPDTQVGSTSTASHILTNTGPTTVMVSTVTSTLTTMPVNKAACTTLASGQSCTLTTTCKPTAAGALKSTLKVTGTPSVSAQGTAACTALAAKVTAAPEPGATTRAGGFTTSGNWVRLTNAGVGPVTFQGLYPAAGWTLSGNLAVPSNCAVNRVLEPGQSCLVLEALNGTQGPGLTVSGSQRVRTTAGDVFWKSTGIKTEGLSFTAVSPFPALQGGDIATAVYSVTNMSAWPLATPITFASTSTAVTISSHTCPAALAAGATCQVTLRYAVPLTAVTPLKVSINATAGYRPYVNGVMQSSTPRSGLQGTLALTLSPQAPKVTLTAGTNTPLSIGQQAVVTHTLENSGVSPVTVTGAPNMSTTTQHTLTGGTCVVGHVLVPGATCTVTTLFKPTTATQSLTTLVVPTSVGTRSANFTGKLVSYVDVRVVLTGPTSSLVDRTNTYTLQVFNGTSGPARTMVSVGVTNSSGAQGYLTSFVGGICGSWSLSSSGTATQTLAPTASTTLKCTPSLGLKQFELTLPAGQSYTATLTATSGPTEGTATVAANATVYDAADSDESNNTAQAATAIKSDLDGGLAALQIGTGHRHTCALTPARGVKCWGYRGDGLMGDGNTAPVERTATSSTYTPHYTVPLFHVSGLASGVASISVGYSHTCALTQSGGVKCWGSNAQGQLGNGAAGGFSNTPVDVVGLSSGVAQVSAGYSHTCAVLSSGALRCWGYNSQGQLGTGNTVASNLPVTVEGLGSVSHVSAGNTHTCVITTAGGVKCWGLNNLGQLGNGTTVNSFAPVSVTGLSSGVSSLSAGYAHTCAVVSGSVKCWGYNSQGQLGDRSQTTRLVPVSPTNLPPGVTEVSAGVYHTCTVSASGWSSCFGANGTGQLGNRSTVGYYTWAVNASTDHAAISAGYGHTCAITNPGVAQCWGWNSSGQLGISSTTNVNLPTNVRK